MELNKENVDFIQGACNPIAVAGQLHTWLKETKNNGTNDLCSNALLCAIVGKLADMFKIEIANGAFTYRYQEEELNEHHTTNE